jgi:hypothetical protein
MGWSFGVWLGVSMEIGDWQLNGRTRYLLYHSDDNSGSKTILTNMESKVLHISRESVFSDFSKRSECFWTNPYEFREDSWML